MSLYLPAEIITYIHSFIRPVHPCIQELKASSLWQKYKFLNKDNVTCTVNVESNLVELKINNKIYEAELEDGVCSEFLAVFQATDSNLSVIVGIDINETEFPDMTLPIFSFLFECEELEDYIGSDGVRFSYEENTSNIKCTMV